MEVYTSLKSCFWSEQYWLPENTTWADLQNRKPGDSFPQASDLYMVLPYTLVMLVIRMIVERLIARPIGIRLNIPATAHKLPAKNTVLEKVYTSFTKKPNQERLKGLCKQLDWSEKQVLSWFRRRSNVDRPTTLVKFSETFWRFIYYLGAFIYGCFVMFYVHGDCTFETQNCWTGYPLQTCTRPMYWYYFISLTFYMSTTITQFIDVKRKDFWEMFIHHIATIILISFSYVINMTKMGGLILLVHDSTDYFLEFAKMGRYSNRESVTNAGFVGFFISFVISRLCILPFWIFRSVLTECTSTHGYFRSWFMFTAALGILQLLHFYWFTHLVRVLYVTLKGEKSYDSRSDTEPEASDDETVSGASGDNGVKSNINKKNSR